MRKIKVENLLIILLLISTVLCYYLSNKNGNILFVTNIVFCILTCIKAKFSIFSLKSILINYVLVATSFQYNTGTSYGILEMNLYPLEYNMMNLLTLIYSTIMYTFIINTKILIKEKIKMSNNYDISKLSTIICCVIAIVFSIIAFPKLNFTFSSSARFQSLLPGNAWNHVVIIALIILIPKFKSDNFVRITYIFCILWFLLHGERVDMIGLLFCCLILFATKKISMISKNKFEKYLKYFLIIFFIIILMVFVGEKRANTNNLSFQYLIKKILVQNTAADLGYVYNISIRYTEDIGLLYGKSYLNYIKELIPFSNEGKSVEFILNDEYTSPGGAFILSEPYMNFGVFGIVIFEIIELYIISLIINKNSKYSFYLYLFLLATTFRTSWYGLVYIETGIVYLLPLLYILVNNVDRRYGYNEAKK